MQRTRHGSIWRGAIAAAIAAAPLAACSHVPDAVNPVEWYRDVAGLSKNDSQELNQRNQKNLEAGADRPYPNLADVPDVPSNATSGIDRDKLKESLVADRENAKYSNEQLQAGRQLASAAPPPPPALSPAPAVAPTPIAPATEQQPQPALASPPTQASQQPTDAARQAAPMESTLIAPQVRSVPQGETPAVPPPPASVVRSAPPARPPETPLQPPATPPAAPQVAATPPPAPPATARQTTAPPAAAIQSPAPRDSQPTLAMRTPAGAANAISVSVGDITFAPGSHDLSAAHRGTLSEIAGLYKQAGGKIRVVGHAEPQGGADPVKQRIAVLNLSLDRANAVAAALTQMGVPASDITVEAAAQRGGQEIPRAEVFMEY